MGGLVGSGCAAATIPNAPSSGDAGQEVVRTALGTLAWVPSHRRLIISSANKQLQHRIALQGPPLSVPEHDMARKCRKGRVPLHIATRLSQTSVYHFARRGRQHPEKCWQTCKLQCQASRIEIHYHQFWQLHGSMRRRLFMTSCCSRFVPSPFFVLWRWSGCASWTSPMIGPPRWLSSSVLDFTCSRNVLFVARMLRINSGTWARRRLQLQAVVQNLQLATFGWWELLIPSRTNLMNLIHGLQREAVLICLITGLPVVDQLDCLNSETCYAWVRPAHQACAGAGMLSHRSLMPFARQQPQGPISTQRMVSVLVGSHHISSVCLPWVGCMSTLELKQCLSAALEVHVVAQTNLGRVGPGCAWTMGGFSLQGLADGAPSQPPIQSRRATHYGVAPQRTGPLTPLRPLKCCNAHRGWRLGRPRRVVRPWLHCSGVAH